jgi:peroxiredoxin
MMPNQVPVYQPGQRLPDFSLPSTLGHPIRISDYRNRVNLVVMICNPQTIEALYPMLAGMNRVNSELAAENTQALVVLPVNLDEAEHLHDEFGLTYPLMADVNGKVAREMIQVHEPGLEMYILDRYGEIYAVERIETGGHLPESREILDWVRFMEIQCPE